MELNPSTNFWNSVREFNWTETNMGLKEVNIWPSVMVAVPENASLLCFMTGIWLIQLTVYHLKSCDRKLIKYLSKERGRVGTTMIGHSQSWKIMLWKTGLDQMSQLFHWKELKETRMLLELRKCVVMSVILYFSTTYSSKSTKSYSMTKRRALKSNR